MLLLMFVIQFTMHGMNNVKVINVQHSRIIHQYTKDELLKANATTWFKKNAQIQTTDIF